MIGAVNKETFEPTRSLFILFIINQWLNEMLQSIIFYFLMLRTITLFPKFDSIHFLETEFGPLIWGNQTSWNVITLDIVFSATNYICIVQY